MEYLIAALILVLPVLSLVAITGYESSIGKRLVQWNQEFINAVFDDPPKPQSQAIESEPGFAPLGSSRLARKERAIEALEIWEQQFEDRVALEYRLEFEACRNEVADLLDGGRGRLGHHEVEHIRALEIRAAKAQQNWCEAMRLPYNTMPHEYKYPRSQYAQVGYGTLDSGSSSRIALGD